MKEIARICIAVIGLFLMAGNTSAALWQVTATWQIGDASPSYDGVSSSKESALEIARANCTAAQYIDDWKHYCKNKPTRTVYSQIPEGSYLKSCNKCKVTGNTLRCEECKPRSGGVALILDACKPDTLAQVENCNGHLACGPCPTKGSGLKYPNKDPNCQRPDCLDR